MGSFLLINPLSGSYSPVLCNELLSQFNSVPIIPQVQTVTGPDDARRACAEIEAISENPLVIIAGGAGTAHIAKVSTIAEFVRIIV
jgi:hypothetical protein